MKKIEYVCRKTTYIFSYTKTHISICFKKDNNKKKKQLALFEYRGELK